MQKAARIWATKYARNEARKNSTKYAREIARN